MASQRVSQLTKQEIASTAKDFRWSRQMPKWTVIVDGKELPARPLILEAAGVPPNDPTNSHQAVAILQDRGFDIYYEGKAIAPRESNRTSQSITDQFIRSVRGSGKGKSSLVEAREHEHRQEDDRIAK